VVNHNKITDWLSRLNEAGASPDVLVPETLALPLSQGSWTILLDTEGALVRTGPQAGFAVDPPNLDMV